MPKGRGRRVVVAAIRWLQLSSGACSFAVAAGAAAAGAMAAAAAAEKAKNSAEALAAAWPSSSAEGGGTLTSKVAPHVHCTRVAPSRRSAAFSRRPQLGQRNLHCSSATGAGSALASASLRTRPSRAAVAAAARALCSLP